LLTWYEKHGRQDLPWQHPREPYRVWISEIMLQQTQVQTVIPYFIRFIERFPNLNTLAAAHEDEVFALWSGLGYYSRARNIHKTAKLIADNYAGQLPSQLEILTTFPGIGITTAAAITSQAFGQSTPILDANVKRVLARYFQVDGPTDKKIVNNRLWELARRCMPLTNSANYTQAIMDLGALICKPRIPLCAECPVQQYCQAHSNKVTHCYPEKKHKKPIPTEQQQFLLLHNQAQQIYLEKRPPVGLWGGLWSLPSMAMEDCPLTYIKKNYALSATTILNLDPFKHSFSHFHLELHPSTAIH
jgi:A/G-specific adenine glycosylase